MKKVIIPILFFFITALPTHVFATATIIEGKTTSSVNVHTTVEGSSSVTTHIQTTVNGNTQTYDSTQPGEIDIQNDGTTINITSIPEASPTMSATISSAAEKTQKEVLAVHTSVWQSLANFLSNLFHFLSKK